MWFQSTLPRREWLSLEKLKHILLLFQSTLPRREWRNKRCWYYNYCKYFNPHSHEGSDVTSVNTMLSASNISIHTPTKGVTYYPNVPETFDFVFQSTLPRREWLCILSIAGISKLFQSTLPRREWQVMVLQLSRRPRISIHTPTKGVTLIIDLLSPLTFDFNPHSHEGSDCWSFHWYWY